MPTLKPDGGIRVKTDTTYLFDPDVVQQYVDEAQGYAAESKASAQESAGYAANAEAWAIKVAGPVEGDNYSAKYNADLAQDWATYMNGKVDGIDYSSKYYANESKEYKESAQNQAGYAANSANQANGYASLAEDWACGSGEIAHGEYSAQHYAEDARGYAAVSENSASLARDYAIKTDEPVQYDEYSAKYYANEAEESATAALDAANDPNVVAVGTDLQSQDSAIRSAPTYAANAKQWAIGDPTEPASGSAKYWAQQAHTYTEGVLNENLISNCITNIPQDIKLELSNGTLTLKSGSVITLPDGTQLTTTADKTVTSAANGIKVVFPKSDGSGIIVATFDRCVSGATDSKTGFPFHVWYDTTNNVIKQYGNDGTTQSNTLALPIGIGTVSNGAISSIDKVFNGAGYVGHHAFVLPGVSFLRVNGKNTDGTLASTKYTRSGLTFIELNSSSHCVSINSGTGIELLKDYISVKTYNDLITDYSAVGRTLQYVIDDNMAYRMAADSPHAFAATRRTLLVRYSYDGTGVTQFDIEPVISVLSQKDICSKSMNPVGLSGTINLPVNTHNFISPTGAVTIALPINVSNTITNEIELQVRQTSAIAFTFDSNILWGGEGTPDMSVGLWDIIFTWIQGANKWLGSYKKWTTS